MKIEFLICLLSSVFCLLFLGCKKKQGAIIEEQPPKPTIPMDVPPPKYETYLYLDMGRRDPFVSLRIPEVITTGVRKGEVATETEKTEEEWSEGWSISGFVWDRNEKMAIIKDKEKSYVFAFGTLSYKNGEVVSDIKVKIKDDGILLVKNNKEVFLEIKEKPIGEENIIE